MPGTARLPTPPPTRPCKPCGQLCSDRMPHPTCRCLPCTPPPFPLPTPAPPPPPPPAPPPPSAPVCSRASHVASDARASLAAVGRVAGGVGGVVGEGGGVLVCGWQDATSANMAGSCSSSTDSSRSASFTR